jgi:hypothetical protein
MNQAPPTIVAGGTPAQAIPPPRRSFHGHRGKNAPKVPNRTHQDARSRILIETPRSGPPLLWRRMAATRDLPTIAFFRAGGAAAT